jgi:hypothetical protein
MQSIWQLQFSSNPMTSDSPTGGHFTAISARSFMRALSKRCEGVERAKYPLFRTKAFSDPTF